MKIQKFLSLLVLSLFIFNGTGCKKSAGSADTAPSQGAVCTIDGVEIPIAEFTREYNFFLKVNYSEGRQEILREDKDEMKKYYQSQFVPQRLFVKYIDKLEMFKNRDFYNQVTEHFKMLGLVQYATYLNVATKYKEPSDAKLKEFYAELQQSNEPQVQEILPKLKNLPWNRQRIGLLEIHKRLMTNRLSLEYLDKIRQENRLIQNDDLEQNLIAKYIKGDLEMDKILNDPDKKLWLLKFNDTIYSAGDIEKMLRLLVELNSGKEQLEKYLKNKKTQNSFRKLVWQNISSQLLIYIDAKKKKLEQTEDGKFFMEAIARSSFAKIYAMKMVENKISEPTDAEITSAYKKLKQKNSQVPAMNAEVKEYIKNQLKQQKAQLEMMRIAERLKDRHVIIMNTKFFQTAEERETQQQQGAARTTN